MKKYITILLALATTNLFAQVTLSDNYLTVIYRGYSSGKYWLQIDPKQQSCSTTIHITWDNDTHITDVSPMTGSSQHSFDLPSSTNFSFTGTYNSHARFNIVATTVCNYQGNPNELIVDLSQFTVTPILLDYFKGEKTDDGLAFTWKTSMEQNVKEFELQHQVNGEGSWVTAQTLAPKGPSIYQTRMVGTLKAGVAVVIVLMLLGGILVQKKKYFAAASIMFVVLTACTKSNVRIPDTQSSLKGTYRLVTQDLDGKLSYSQVLQF